MNNLVVFLNLPDLKYTSYQDEVLYNHIDTTRAIDNFLNSNNKWVYTTDLISLNFDIIDRDTYNSNIYLACFYDKFTMKPMTKFDKTDKIILKLLPIAKCNEIIQNTSKEIRIGHSLMKLVVGGHFNLALERSSYKLPIDECSKEHFLNYLMERYS